LGLGEANILENLNLFFATHPACLLRMGRDILVDIVYFGHNPRMAVHNSSSS